MAPVMVVVPELANKYGLHEALVLRQLHYWLERATYVEDGVPWVRKSITEWSAEFTWWKRSTVHRLFAKLAEEEVVAIRSDEGRTFYTINYHKLSKAARDAIMLSENRTGTQKRREQPSENRTERDAQDVMLSENRTISPTPSIPLSENRTELSENRTANNKEYTEITTDSTNERGRQPPARIPSHRGATKVVRMHSPYLEARRFVNGFIPPGTGRNAVEVYYERFSINNDDWRLTEPLEDDLVADCKDLALLREVVTAYHQAGFKKPRNVKLILDWYRHPERFRSDHHGTHSGHGAAEYRAPETAAFSQREWREYRDPRADEIPF